jgi:hypothetical protein
MVKGNKDMKTTAQEMKTKTIAMSLGLILVAGGYTPLILGKGRGS